jgi:hypothetical protein
MSSAQALMFTAKMDLFQKKILKQILSLPKNAPDCAVYILTGIWPIELQIQYKTLIFYNNICNLIDSSLEKEIARRQLSIEILFVFVCWS